MEVINYLEEIRNTGNDLHPKITLGNRLVPVSDAPLLEPETLAEERNVLARIKLHTKTKAPSPTPSSVSADTEESDANIKKKRETSRRLVELQIRGVRYNLRSTPTTLISTWKETV
jgi:D-mannonate dehydratase